MTISRNHEQMEVQPTFTIPFTQVQNEVIDCLGFENPVDKLVYISLLRFGFHKGEAWPSVNKLAMMFGSSENRIRQSLERLEKMKLISIIKRTKANGEPDTNKYLLHDLSPELKQNTIMNAVAVSEFKEKEKERKSEKEKKKNEKTGTSKNEPPASNFEVPSSKNEPPTSNFEDKEYLSNKKNLKTKKNKGLSIQDLDLEIRMLGVTSSISDVLRNQIDRLIELNITLKDLKNLKTIYNAAERKISESNFCLVLNNVLNAERIDYFSKYLQKAIDTAVERNKQTKTEILPNWFDDKKGLVHGVLEQEDQEKKQPNWDEMLKQLPSQRKGNKE